MSFRNKDIQKMTSHAHTFTLYTHYRLTLYCTFRKNTGNFLIFTSFVQKKFTITIFIPFVWILTGVFVYFLPFLMTSFELIKMVSECVYFLLQIEMDEIWQLSLSQMNCCSVCEWGARWCSHQLILSKNDTAECIRYAIRPNAQVTSSSVMYCTHILYSIRVYECWTSIDSPSIESIAYIHIIGVNSAGLCWQIAPPTAVKLRFYYVTFERDILVLSDAEKMKLHTILTQSYLLCTYLSKCHNGILYSFDFFRLRRSRHFVILWKIKIQNQYECK